MTAALAELLAALERRGDGPVALGAEGPRSARELLALAAHIAERLPEASPGSEVCFSIDADRFGLAAGLLAAWCRGHTAALPQDGTRDSVFPVYARTTNVALVQDTGIRVGVDVGGLARETHARGTPLAAPADGDDERPAVRAFHRLPLQDEQQATWSHAGLWRDARRFAGELRLEAGGVLVSSLAPLVPASLWLGLLAPLAADACFAAGTWRPGEEGALATRLAEHPGARLVTSPAHARALLRSDVMPLALGALAVVDEGVEAATHRACRERLGAAPVPAPRVPFDVEEPERLVALREALLARDDVRDAALVAWCVTPVDRAARETVDLVAVVAPEADRAALEELVRERLAGAPCELRLVPALPRDGDGRLAPWRIALLFGHGRAGPRLVRELEWHEGASAESGERCFHSSLPEPYAFLEGHYVDWPVLAGAVQLTELVLPCARRVLPPEVTGAGLERVAGLKFLERIGAGAPVEVRLAPGGERELRFEIRSRARRCSIGRLRFAAPSA